MVRKIASAELAGFFERELENHAELTLSDALRLLGEGADPETDPKRVGHLLDETTELIGDHGPDTPLADFLPKDSDAPGSPGTRG